MNKKFLFGMIALLSVSLFFLGCPTEADDDPPPAAPVPVGVVSAVETTPGTDTIPAVEAVYTVGITTALGAGDTITFANVADANVVYDFVAGTATAEAQATAIRTAIGSAEGALYDVSGSDAQIILTAKAGGVIASAPTATITNDSTPVGAVSEVAVTTAGTNEAEAVYTVEISTALGVGDTITFANVADANVGYSYAGSVTEAAAQATAIAAAISSAEGAVYTAAVGAGDDANKITLTAKAPGVIANAPTATITNDTIPVGEVSSVAVTTAGAAAGAAVQAVYTVTITTAIVDGEKITLTNVLSGTGDTSVDLYYDFDEDDDTAPEQATAIVTELTDEADNALYTAAVGSGDDANKITLTAKTAGVITNAPTATVTFAD
jgi:hypothetical protein